MAQWVIYERPRDYPHGYIARKWLVVKGRAEPVWTRETAAHEDVEVLRDVFRQMGLYCLPRSPEDEPQILETWI